MALIDIEKVFCCGLVCLLWGACSAGPIDIDSAGALGINNNWQIEVKSVAAEYEHNPTLPAGPIYEVLHVHHVPLTIPLHTSIVVHDKHQIVPQTHHLQRDAADKSCMAPNGAGLTRLFAEAYEILPQNQIVEIISRAYKHDKEVRAFHNILFSQAVIDSLSTIRDSIEFEKLSDYVCQCLNVDINSYLKVVRLLIAAKQEEDASAMVSNEQSSWEEHIDDQYNGRPGVRGLVQDIYEILPRQQLRQLYERGHKSDYYVASAVDNLKDPQFRRLVENLRFVPEYKKLRDILISAGLPLNEYSQLMAAAMGWDDEKNQVVIAP